MYTNLQPLGAKLVRMKCDKKHRLLFVRSKTPEPMYVTVMSYVNRCMLLLCQSAYCLVCDPNPDYEIMPLDGVYSPVVPKYQFNCSKSRSF